MTDEAIYEFGVLPRCWLASFTKTPCAGRLQRCHLLPKQSLRREMWQSRRWRESGKLPATFHDLVWDERTWVPGCARHHFLLDEAGRLTIPRDRLPEGVEAFAAEWELGWLVERLYGAARSAAA